MNTPITPQALLEIGFKDVSYTDEGILFFDYQLYEELFELNVYANWLVDIKIGKEWHGTNASTMEDIQHLIRLFK
jgi:hypothetical protein